MYAVPIVGFPLAAMAIHLGLNLKLGSVRPAIEFYCDSSSPQWYAASTFRAKCLSLTLRRRLRFLSYAGAPFLLSIPSLILSIQSVRRVQETNQHIERARTTEFEMSSDLSDDGGKPRRTFSFKRRTQRREKGSAEFDSEDDTTSKARFAARSSEASGGDASATTIPSLKFSFAPFAGRRSSTAAPAAAALKRLRGGAGEQAQPAPPPATVRFHIPVKAQGSEDGRAQDSPSPTASTEKDDDESDESQSPSQSPAIGYPTLKVYERAQGEVGSSEGIAEVGRRTSRESGMSQIRFNSSSPNSQRAGEKEGGDAVDIVKRSESWESLEENVEGKGLEKDWREVGSVYSETKVGLDEDEEEREIEERLRARPLPKRRTHSKVFNNDSE